MSRRVNQENLKDLEIKTERITQMLGGENLDAVILNAQHNFAWLTDGGSNRVDESREAGEASLLITKQGNRYLLVNNIETPRILAEEISAQDFEPVEFPWQSENGLSDIPFTLARSLPGVGASIATDIPLFAGAKSIENKISHCRYQLTNNEIGRFRDLGRDAGVAFRKAIDRLVPGETESEVAEKLRHELAIGGMTAVVTLVGADERIASFRHPIPTEKIWKKTLLIVTCAKRKGLIVSLSRIVCVGNAPDELLKRTDATAYVNASLLNATRPGMTGKQIYAVADKAYEDQGFAGEIGRHHQGGAAGYRTREWVAHPESNEVVQLHQAFAWNPSITGTKVEETCITTENGVEVITASPDFPQIATIVDGREYISPGILSI